VFEKLKSSFVEIKTIVRQKVKSILQIEKVLWRVARKHFRRSENASEGAANVL